MIQPLMLRLTGQLAAAVSISVVQGLEREYDRLLAEHDALQKKLLRMGGQPYSAGDKKSA